MTMQLPARYLKLALVIAIIVVIAAIFLESWQISDNTSVRWHILWQLQLPLLLTAITVGAALAVSSGTLQVVLHNPLADPGIIGITSGASLIAAVLLLALPAVAQNYFHYILPAACFAGALLSTWLIYRIAHYLQGAAVAVILAGIAISTVSGAIMAWLFLFADAQSLRNLTFWLMGSLYQADWWVIGISGPIMIVSVVYQLRQARQLNWLYAGELQAASAGVAPQALTRRSLIAAALGVGAAVSVAGSIAFLGLLVPHFLRLLIGFDNRQVLPASALLGALILLLVVLLTETFRLITLPVSMVTATLGGPLLLLALFKGRWQ
ncbi:iron ABC transporter permease [Alteromonas pelagimontana]|uniref:Iron ABC transporter permease n=1 Tax=Alteromonas pelagimontana TaxID=1858656 RepID=A0A6M4MB65_9ALTE|nr:iron ABC transporter permease [Alteromonas pelagimontana]QJR79795.1 iron ABC transporter permease [Alteromonas pelagimontana]